MIARFEDDAIVLSTRMPKEREKLLKIFSKSYAHLMVVKRDDGGKRIAIRVIPSTTEWHATINATCRDEESRQESGAGKI